MHIGCCAIIRRSIGSQYIVYYNCQIMRKLNTSHDVSACGILQSVLCTKILFGSFSIQSVELGLGVSYLCHEFRFLSLCQHFV